jgi:hypothetical protein
MYCFSNTMTLALQGGISSPSHAVRYTRTASRISTHPPYSPDTVRHFPVHMFYTYNGHGEDGGSMVLRNVGILHHYYKQQTNQSKRHHQFVLCRQLALCFFFNSAPRHEGVLGKWRYSSTHSLTSALDGVGGRLQAPAALLPGKESLVPIG